MNYRESILETSKITNADLMEVTGVQFRCG